MKFLFIGLAALSLSSCNTLIGLGRDTAHGYRWSKEKIQGATQKEESYGAPVY